MSSCSVAYCARRRCLWLVLFVVWSALAGLGDDSRFLTLSAPVQTGNAIVFGKAWSIYAACGQTQTNDESIARGIGPISAERWGL